MTAPEYLGSYYLRTLHQLKVGDLNLSDEDRMDAVEELVEWGLVCECGDDFAVTPAGDARLEAGQR